MAVNTLKKRELRLSDYSLVGKDSQLAIEKGLAEATWYASPVPKEKMRELLQRRDRGLRHGVPVQLVPAPADGQLLPPDLQRGPRRRRLHHLDGLRHDFQADVISRQDSDLQHVIPRDQETVSGNASQIMRLR